MVVRISVSLNVGILNINIMKDLYKDSSGQELLVYKPWLISLKRKAYRCPLQPLKGVLFV